MSTEPHVRLATRAAPATFSVVAQPLGVTPVVVAGGVLLPFASAAARDDAAAALQRNRALLRRTLDDPSLEVHTGP